MKSRVPSLLGALCGLIIPFLSLVLISKVRPELLLIQQYSFEEIQHLNIQLMTVAMLPNVALFFIAIQFNRDKFSQGILGASLLLIAALFIYRFLL